MVLNISGSNISLTILNSWLYHVEPDKASIYIIMTIIAGFGNLGTIMAFITDSQLRLKPSNLIMVNLACTDLGIALLTMPRIAIQKSFGYWPFGEVGCRLMLIMTDLTLHNVGLYTIVLLSWDRYQMLVLDYPYYLKKHNRKSVIKLIIITWIAGSFKGIRENITWNTVLASLPTWINFNLICLPPSLVTFTGALLELLHKLIVIIIVGLLGTLIVKHLHVRIQKWQQINPMGTSIQGHDSTSNGTSASNTPKAPAAISASDKPVHNSSLNNAPILKQQINAHKLHFKKRYIKPICTYMLLVLALLVCNIPLFSYNFIVATHTRSRGRDIGYIIDYLKILIYFNSCLNPIFYALTNARIRVFYQKKYKYIFSVPLLANLHRLFINTLMSMNRGPHNPPENHFTS